MNIGVDFKENYMIINNIYNKDIIIEEDLHLLKKGEDKVIINTEIDIIVIVEMDNNNIIIVNLDFKVIIKKEGKIENTIIIIAVDLYQEKKREKEVKIKIEIIIAGLIHQLVNLKFNKNKVNIQNKVAQGFQWEVLLSLLQMK